MSNEYILEERKFLHDIASPLTILLLNLQNIEERLGAQKQENVDSLRVLQKCMQQTEKAIGMLEQRRGVLMQRQEQ